MEVVGRLTRLTRTMIKRGEAMVDTVAVLIWKNNALQCVNKKDIQPNMFKDIQPKIFKDIETKDIQRCSKIFKRKIFKPNILKDIQTKDIQRHSNHLEECLGHCLAKYVSRYTAVHTWWGECIIQMFFGTV